MDVIKSSSKKKNVAYKRAIAMVFFVILALCWLLITTDDRVEVLRKESLFSNVQQGEFIVSVDGYGEFKSNDQKLITSRSQATVEEVLLKPGASVQPDSVILKLSNPEIEENVLIASQELTKEYATLKQIELSQKREIMTEKVKYAELEASYEISNLNFQAQSDLSTKGIVSKLNFAESDIKTQQMSKVLAIYRDQIEQLKLIHTESINMQKEIIKQAESNLRIAKDKLDRLTIKAGMSGVLQQSFVTLGQTVSSGAQLALISGTENLVGIIKVPQTQADMIKLGQKAKINTRKEIIEGNVARIDPVVTEGTVSVEIKMEGELPSNIRPELSIDGTIEIESIPDTFFIKRPANIQPNSVAKLYLVAEGLNQASAKEVTFGVESGQYIQILSNVNIGETYIISDTSALASAESIVIKQ
ncbi:MULTISPECIES: efflux RND transporter periplasmic adaptor subunit [Pseudoalteromonas]|uniref:HlyD family efflux transporter periplasmic adaptor subunit n=1 Tax=Pseudoalteromonas rubra TaxID=43658 RepID=A0A5S3UXN7_9GAMM|nr:MULTISPECIES: efflux RND transporter periplasmic adaptor subunit [Pseudoalteromonas]MCG7563688.1 HlyD family secretion protein [Pseudoalteromonas sp. McH1-42]MEC4090307.1 efflux RND transporter periplasmic adaptor subunit [Pseudoalteromonas rubra]QPB85029.1 HlyD family efflux transporter periplasmic adaptor subunit [Pseudoalteromonas rubra]